MSSPSPDVDPATGPTPEPPADPPPQSSPEPPKDDRGFPPDTPLREMTVEQQRDYWKHQARKHEDTAKSRADYGDLKAKAAEADKLRKERESEHEKAVREAAEKAAAEARAAMIPQVVSARFAAAAAGRIDPDRLATLIDDIDMTRYLKEDGAVDVEKVAAKVNAWAPPKEEPKKLQPDPTQGARNTKTTGTDAGRAMFDARRGKKPAA